MKYKVGMYGGSFNPLHLGHVNDIIIASNLCEKLYLILSVSHDPNEIDHRERFMWLKSITRDMDHVEVFEIFDESHSKDTYNWKAGASSIKNRIPEAIDVVFCGDDYKNKNIWEKLYPESEVYYIPRKNVPISSTEIRNHPYQYFEYLPKCVRPYYTKKVCIVGTESCGKTTLVRHLAQYFNTTYVIEAGRYICDSAGGIDNMQPYHYFDILIKHKELENKALQNANKILLIDTDALVTLYYYQLGFERNEKDKTFESLAREFSLWNHYDLYLFLKPDVKWVQDGTRTYGEEVVRKENHIKLKKILDENHIPYFLISGDYNERYEQAKKIIKNIMK